jgi:hypothetical protein
MDLLPPQLLILVYCGQIYFQHPSQKKIGGYCIKSLIENIILK